METFPVELLTAIIDEVYSRNDLLALRRVCRLFHTLATPRAFRLLNILTATQSVDELEALLGSEELRKLVKEVVLTYRTQEFVNKHFNDLDEHQDHIPTEPFSVWRLHKFPNLRNLRFAFDDQAVGTQETLYHLAAFIQASALETLCNPYPLSLRTLTLHNIFARPQHPFNERAFRQCLAQLKELTLHFIYVPRTTSPYISEHVFWTQILYDSILSPPQSSLTSLTLHCDKLIGFLIHVRWESLYFPCLTSLSLGHIVFVNIHPHMFVEEFILRHKDTLRRLELHSCSMLSIPSLPHAVRTWSDVWGRFEAELDNLLVLLVTRDQNRVGTSTEYIKVSRGSFQMPVYTPDVDDVADREADGPALTRLQTVLEARRLRDS